MQRENYALGFNVRHTVTSCRQEAATLCPRHKVDRQRLAGGSGVESMLSSISVK